MDLYKKDGTKYPVQLAVTARNENNTIYGLLGIAIDISKIKPKQIIKSQKNDLEILNAKDKFF
jgi:hypothetical protein